MSFLRYWISKPGYYLISWNVARLGSIAYYELLKVRKNQFKDR